MLRSEDELQATIELFRLAALGRASWEDAMAALATACNGASANLGASEDGILQYYWTSEIDPAVLVELGEAATSEEHNPRMWLASQAAPLQPVDGVDFASDDWVRRFPVYGEVCRKYDLGFGSLMTLKAAGRDYIGMAVIRTEKQGHGSSADADALTTLAPYLKDAVMLRRMVEDQGALMTCGAIEAMGAAAFLCDAGGKVRNLTPSAEALVDGRGPLTLKAQVLGCRSPESARTLSSAIELAARNPATPVRTIVVKDERGVPLVLDVAALPPLPGMLAFTPRAIVTARPPRPPAPAGILMTVYGLTQAEADVARALAQGDARESIAERRGVAVGTIRAQLKGIFGKLGVSREAELIAKIYQVPG